MRPTGPRSLTDASPRGSRDDGRRLPAPAVVACCLLACLCAVPAAALDVFTLWRQPEAPLAIARGDRVDYVVTTLEAGRRRVEVMRIQCVEQTDASWRIEVLPLDETDAGRVPRPGEGLSLEVAVAMTGREGALADHVLEIEQWSAGERHVLPPEEWRDDPLAEAFLSSDFVPDAVESQGSTTRVVGEADLLCRQLTLVAADTTRIELPRGEMVQVHTREISAAIHADVPFLGIAYAAERSETRSELIPAGRRRPPPPAMSVETMELVDFGHDAVRVLPGG